MNVRTSAHRLPSLVSWALLCLVGCAPQASPNAASEPAVKAAAPQAVGPIMAAPPGSGPQLTCETPPGWTSAPASGMRKLAFAVRDGERAVEVTAIDLAASAGGLLPNVNRWRKQIQLGEITQEELDQAVTSIPAAGGEGQYVELLGPEDAQPRQATLGVVVIRDDRSWFFKLSGDADLALREKERFAAFVKSVQFVTASESAAPATAAQAGSDSHLVWDVPGSWTVDEATAARRGAYHVTEGDRQAEITVLEAAQAFDPEMLLLNVNRWRRLVQLGELTPDQLAQAATPLQVAGMDGNCVELLGPEDAQPRLAAVRIVVSRAGKTWLFSLTGDANLVLREKDRFLGFVKSARFATEPSSAGAAPASGP